MSDDPVTIERLEEQTSAIQEMALDGLVIIRGSRDISDLLIALRDYRRLREAQSATVTRLAPKSFIAPIQDRADDLIREMKRQGMNTLRASFDGMDVRIDPTPKVQP